MALQLDVDFSKAGLLGTSSIPFGDLILQNLSSTPALNGPTVTQFLADANSCLGGGTCVYSATVLDDVAAGLYFSFEFGVPGTVSIGGVSFSAHTNLALPGSVVATPEPSSLLLVAIGLLGLGWTRHLKRAR